MTNDIALCGELQSLVYRFRFNYQKTFNKFGQFDNVTESAAEKS